MGDLSENFSRKEFVCKCGCGEDTVDAELIEVLQRLREALGSPITVTEHGGFRCINQNTRSGGSFNSQHLRGRAADIKVKDHNSRGVFAILSDFYPRKFGMGSYETFVHIDTRSGGPARWEE